MPHYSEEYTHADAAYDAAMDRRKKAIEACKEADKGFVWRWRIVESINEQIANGLRVKDPAKFKSLSRRVKHLEKYCEDAISDELAAMADSVSEQRDPYAYRGLSRSMFL